MKRDFMFTCESVTEGHPDKLCDQISDALVDRYLQQDPCSRVVAECAVSNGILFVAVRHASRATVDVSETARQVISQAGYTENGFDARNCTIVTSIAEMERGASTACDERSLDDEGIERINASHTANAFGYACDHNPGGLPHPLWLAHKLARQIAKARTEPRLRHLGPDGKTQVGVEFVNRRPRRLHSITLMVGPQDGRTPSELRADLLGAVIEPAFADEEIRPDAQTRIYVNPEGPWVVGGPSQHSGLTGRKTAIDTYGEYSRNSSAALSGKDPSRIDRVGVYAARHAARNVIAAALARECEVHLTYSIAQARPVSVQVDTLGTGLRPDHEIAELLGQVLDFRPAAIVRQFDLRRLPLLVKGGFYRRLAAYGHVGRVDLDAPWERADRVAELLESA
jgi:S-adenosylmethionine synthetase